MPRKDFDLLDKRPNLRLIGRNEIAVYGSSRNSKVVCKDERCVVFGNQVVDPIVSARGCLSRQGGVTDGVRGIWLYAFVLEADSRVAVTTGITCELTIRPLEIGPLTKRIYL